MLGNLYKNLRKGFTIIELSIVLTIMGTVLYIVLSIGASYYQVNQVKVTDSRLNEIQRQLLLYLKKNGNFPCPADPTKAKTDSNYAAGEVCSGTCSVSAISADSKIFYSGDVPAILLGLNGRFAEDGYGFKFRYFVPKNLACNSKADSDYYENSLLYVKHYDGSTETEISNDLAYILVSHGENGFGAYTVAGSQNSNSANSSEAENSDADNVFHYNYIKNNNYDDHLRFKSKTQILMDLDDLYSEFGKYRYWREECNAASVPANLLPFCFNE